MLNELWISSRALTQMRLDAERAFPLETGGVLVGYRVGADQIITASIDAGPRAIRTRTTFEGDHEYQCAELDRVFSASGGVTVYLGDWHTHPSSRPHLSTTDKRTLRGIAGHASANSPNPIMIIGGGGPSDWIWKAHAYEKARTFFKISSRPLRTFAGMLSP